MLKVVTYSHEGMLQVFSQIWTTGRISTNVLMPLVLINVSPLGIVVGCKVASQRTTCTSVVANELHQE